MTAVLWDLDGTLVDSAGDIAANIDRMLVAFDLPALGESSVRSFVGHGALHLVDFCVRAAGGTPSSVHVERFLAEYEAHLDEHTRIHPPELRTLIAGVRSPQAVVTNKPERITRLLLGRLGWGEAFAAIIGGDTTPCRKPSPEPVWEAMRRLGSDRAVLVGDGPTDIGAARAAGIPSIGVSWGIGSPAGAEVIVDTVDALRAALWERGVS